MKILLYLTLYILIGVACRTEPNNQVNLIPDEFKLIENTLAQNTFGLNSIAALDTLLPHLKSCSLPKCDSLYGESCRRAGLYFYKKPEYNHARQYYKQGLLVNPPGDLPGRLYCNLGLSYHAEKRYYESLDYFDKARLAGESETSAPYYYVTLLFLGDSYQKMGQLSIAEQYLEQAIDIAKGIDNHSFLAEAMLFTSAHHRLSKNYGKAIASGKVGIDLLKNLERFSYNDFLSLTGCYLNIGNAWQDSILHAGIHPDEKIMLGDSAVFYSVAALKLYQENGFQRETLTSMLNLGELYRRQGKLTDALTILGNAIDSLTPKTTTLADYRLLAQLYLNRGEAFLDVDNLNAAERDFKASLSHLAPNSNKKNTKLLPPLNGPIVDLNILIYLLGDIAALEKKLSQKQRNPLNHLSNALEAYDSILVLADRLKREFITDEDKIFLAQEVRVQLDSAFSLCIKLNKLSPNSQVYEPMIKHLIDVDKVQLDEKAAIYESAYIGYGKGGFTFEEPGSYTLKAIYTTLDNSIIVSNEIKLRVKYPVTVAEEEIAELYMGEEQGQLFYLLGSDAPQLQTGNDAFDQVIKKYSKNPLSSYAALIKGINASRDFKTIGQDKTIAVRSSDVPQNEKMIKLMVDHSKNEQGVDNITLNMAMRNMANCQKNAGNDKAASQTMANMIAIFEKKGLRKDIMQHITTQAQDTLD